MSNYIRQFNFIPQLVCEILQFKESCILIGSKFLDHNSRTRLFPESFLEKVRRPLLLSHSSKKVSMNRLDLCKNPKNLILKQLFGFFDPTELFQKSGFVTFLTL